MDRNELLWHLQKCEKLHERNKLKRFIYTVLAYAAGLMLVFYWQEQFSGVDIWEALATIVFCIILSFVICLINALVFGQLFKKSQSEEAALEYLRKRIRDKEQEDNHKKEML